MKEDKICLSKSVAFIAVVAFILIGVVVFTNYVNTQSTATGTRAAGEKAAACQKMAGWVAYAWTGRTGAADPATNNTCVKFTGGFLGETATHTRPNGGTVTRLFAVSGGYPAGMTSTEVSGLGTCELSDDTTDCYNPVSAASQSTLATTCKANEGKVAYSWNSDGTNTGATNNMCVTWLGTVYDDNRKLPIPNGGTATNVTVGDLKCWYGPAVTCASVTPGPDATARQATITACDALKGKIAYSWGDSGAATPDDACVTYTGNVFDYGLLSHTVPNGGTVTNGATPNTKCALSDDVRCVDVQPAVSQVNKTAIINACKALKDQVAYTWNGDGTTGAGRDNLCVTYTGDVLSFDLRVAKNIVPLGGNAKNQAAPNRMCALSEQMSCVKPWICPAAPTSGARVTGAPGSFCSQSATYLTENAVNAGIAGTYATKAQCETACF